MGDGAVTLDALLAVIDGPATIVGNGAETEIDLVTHDSRAVGARSLFACLRGERADGHRFAGQAVEAGAVALLVDHRLDEADVGATPQIIVDDTRRRLGPIAAAVAGHPSRRLRTVGLTGTNGKTTTSLMLASIFETHGWRTGVIGTLSGPRTTPEAPELQRTLAEFVVDGDDAAVLEVSSHALALHRVDGTEFDVVVFTNFGRDHLDLHGTPEEYFRAKALLFTPQFAPLGVINVDDTHGRLLADAVAALDSFSVVTYSASELSDVVVEPSSISYVWQGTHVDVNIGGDFNVLNSLAAMVTATSLGIAADVAAEGLRVLPGIPGRFETVTSATADAIGFSVVVDYAHTPDGLDGVLTAARGVVGVDAAVIVVFGCGGDRDHEKRPEMGAAAVRHADRVVITSDNPRREEPDAIIADIYAGIEAEYRHRVMLIPDRRTAIREALNVAGRGDIVVIAGKGHEQTQDLGGETVAFDDRAVARSFLEDCL